MQKNSTKIITSPEMQSVSPGWFLTEAMLSKADTSTGTGLCVDRKVRLMYDLTM